jgi:hypothetical protein
MLAIWPIATRTLLEKTMKKYVRLTLGLALLCAALSTATFASSMFLVQGIAGRDRSADTDPAYPVDVLLNDEVCYVHGEAFGQIIGPLTFEPGTYNVKVSIANSLAPCTNSPMIDSSVTLEPRKDVSAVFALTNAGTPTLLTFTNNFSPVNATMGRVLFAQAANAPELQVVLQNTATMKLYTYTVNRGALLDVCLPAGDYTVEVNQGSTTLVAPTFVDLYAQSATLLYATGQASNHTVTLETRTVRDVI